MPGSPTVILVDTPTISLIRLFSVDAALAHFKAFDDSQEVLRRDIAAVDLRISDRVTVRLTPEALERRKSAVLERSKELKKREKS